MQYINVIHSLIFIKRKIFVKAYKILDYLIKWQKVLKNMRKCDKMVIVEYFIAWRKLYEA